jgi:hypothetical protein
MDAMSVGDWLPQLSPLPSRIAFFSPRRLAYSTASARAAYRRFILSASMFATGIVAKPSEDVELRRLVDSVRQDILRGSKRAGRFRSYDAIRAAGERARKVPPTQPTWLIRMAPWARHWGMQIPRGRRRTRDWT